MKVKLSGVLTVFGWKSWDKIARRIRLFIHIVIVYNAAMSHVVSHHLVMNIYLCLCFSVIIAWCHDLHLLTL